MVDMVPQLLLAAAGVDAPPSWILVTLAKLLVVATALVLPFYLGRIIAKSLRMPDYGTKIGLILCAIIASTIVLMPKPAWLFLGWPPKLGIDLKGGVILVYELDTEGRSMKPSSGRSSDDDSNDPQDKATIDTQELATALTKRLNPDGLKEIVIRPFGKKQIEIIIPDVDPLEIEAIKRLIGQAGILEFRIVANGRDHRDVIDLAVSQAEDPGRPRDVRNAKGDVVGFWARVGREEKTKDGVKLLKVPVWRDTIRDAGTGQILSIPDMLLRQFDDKKGQFEQYLADQGIAGVDVLMYAGDGQNITGAELANVSAGFEGLEPKVDFAMRTTEAARRMGTLTGANLPDGEFRRLLGIVLDGSLLSAPSIQSLISERGQITGRFSQAEVDELVKILRAGQLPAALNKVPVSENQIGSLLGGDMIVKSAWAIAISALVVYLFVIYYYRLAGVIAAMVLTVNIVMILALMILIQAPLTLPGLAGLVLTVGMAVDANVLIFERMREEQARGAALRMVIRNGFDRAFSTILDSNITTVITAVILYVIGTDQVRGFAVTLTLGLLISMFTAVFCARVIFDIIERKRWATKFNMRQMLATTNYDFMKIWKGFTAASVVIIVIGLVAVVARGKSLFDIDFNGGTSVQPLLKEEVSTDDVRSMLREEFERDKTQYSLTNIQVASGTNAEQFRGRVFKIDTSVSTVNDLQDRLRNALKDKSGNSLLATYEVTYDAPRAVEVKGRTKAGGQAEAAKPKTPLTVPDDAKGDDKPSDPPVENPAPPCGVSAQEEPATGKPETTGKPSEDTVKKADDVQAETPAADAPADDAPVKVAPAVDPPTADPPTADPPTTGGIVPVARRVQIYMESKLNFETKINGRTLLDRINEAAGKEGISPPQSILKTSVGEWDGESSNVSDQWIVQLSGSEGEAKQILSRLKTDLAKTPVFLSSSEVGGQVADDTKQRAVIALLASMVGIVLYIWLRFQHVVWGLAAVLALVHDVLVMLAAVAVSLWLEPLLSWMMVEEFKINLTMIAAFLTLVGYSINDTIVLFDRLREIRGKSPHLTREMINQSINQTLSRTILTALTVFLVVVILYFFGGESIHGFAFAMVVGTFAGSYSSIYIAAPVLLRLSEPEKSKKPEPVAAAK